MVCVDCSGKINNPFMVDYPKASYKSFIRSLTVYTVILAVISYVIRHWVPEIPITSSYLFIILFMFGVTLAILWLLNKSMDVKLSRFANAFMLLIFGKILFYIVIIFIYAYLNRDEAVSFIISFFIYYIFYTGFEIFVLLKINQQKENS